MRGLVKGEASSVANPVLQLFCRSGGFLTDLFSGTFKIDDIHSSAVALANKVVSTAFGPAHKLGTGRYVIPTGGTSAWNYGTHRVTCAYRMTNGGPDFTQAFDFEILDPADWASSAAYIGYLSTRRAWQDTYAASTVAVQTLHRQIAEVSRRIEAWTGRWFEPRYVKLKKTGEQDPALILNQPIIAIEDIYAVWQTTTGEDAYKYEQYLYKVYNRHLDGFAEEDDRILPKIELTDVDGTIVEVSDFAWPYGNQNIELRGAFGWTDPEFDPTNSQVLVGQTPIDIGRACGAMIARMNEDPTLTSVMTWSPGSVSSIRTRDQSVSFGRGGGAGGSGGASEPSGDPLVDAILVKYCQPMGVGAL